MDLLNHLVDLFGQNGYAAVFLALMLCGAGAPLPEDITLVAGGIITGLGYGDVHTMVGVGMAGVLVGDSTMFLLGRHFGARIMRCTSIIEKVRMGIAVKSTSRMMMA